MTRSASSSLVTPSPSRVRIVLMPCGLSVRRRLERVLDLLARHERRHRLAHEPDRVAWSRRNGDVDMASRAFRIRLIVTSVGSGDRTSRFRFRFSGGTSPEALATVTNLRLQHAPDQPAVHLHGRAGHVGRRVRQQEGRHAAVLVGARRSGPSGSPPSTWSCVWSAVIPCFLPAISSSCLTRSVSMRPGMIWLTRILSAASSSASVLDSADTDARSTVESPRFGIGSFTESRGRHQDRAAAARLHRRHRRAHHPQRAEEQQVDRVLPRRVVERQRGAGGRAAAVGEQQIDAAEPLDRLRRPRGGCDRRCGRPRPSPRTVGAADEIRAAAASIDAWLLDEIETSAPSRASASRDGEAEPAARPADHRDFAFQTEIHCLPRKSDQARPAVAACATVMPARGRAPPRRRVERARGRARRCARQRAAAAQHFLADRHADAFLKLEPHQRHRAVEHVGRRVVARRPFQCCMIATRISGNAKPVIAPVAPAINSSSRNTPPRPPKIWTSVPPACFQDARRLERRRRILELDRPGARGSLSRSARAAPAPSRSRRSADSPGRRSAMSTASASAL